MTTRESTSDCDYDEEEIIVFADFKNNILNELQTTNPSIKIIGIDSQNPIAEVNGNIFKGTYDLSMGTHVVFEEDDNPPPIDPIYEKYSKKTFKYFNKTNKVLNFSRIFVESENSATEKTQESISTNKKIDKNPLIVDTTYEEALKALKNKQN
ncbi:general transcription factor 3C polypeptide 6 isoform X1 [Episyrphus balteatus]|uniref:general transcription factor 3C polypeptide 6 isoform X1 n=1 Tax=Episyrphus balteatus TaxID=286459 RepID=UPI002484E61B|nr:general transcription factor 3C polypeptide 6 isoform X1 [Episyrphus balteatus]